MKRIPTLTALLAVLAGLGACGEREAPVSTLDAAPQAPVAPPAAGPADGITATDLMSHIRVLASDEFGGRAPMSKGERLTLEYLENAFVQAGLQPMFGTGFRQAVPLVSIAADPDMELLVRGPGEAASRSYAYGPEAMLWTPHQVESVALEDSELVWVGYGIVAPEYDWDDYAGLDVAGKTVVMLVNDPGFATRNPEQFNGLKMTYYGRWTYKYQEAARQGAAGALIIHQTEPAGYGWNVIEDGRNGPQFHLVAQDRAQGRVRVEGWLQYPVAGELLAAAGHDLAELAASAAEGSSAPLPLGMTASVEIRNRLAYAESWNVGAVRHGSARPDELFIYMAHWDHLGTAEGPAQPGVDRIYNGAEDNASGTAGLLEIAEAFAGLDQAPARSVGFLAVTAEESGLLGSKAYTEEPAWPMRQTVAGINMDRLNFRGLMEDVVVIGQGASEMEDILALEARAFGRTVTPEATPEKGFYYRSDHFNFARKGVPILYARGGTVDREHGAEYVTRRNAEYVANRYHAPSDEIREDWNVDAAVEDLRLFFHVGLRVADSDVWPEWYAGNEFRAIRQASLEGESAP